MSTSREHSRLERSLTILFVAVVIGLMAGAAITLLLPKKYRSTVTLQVKGTQTAEVRNSIILSKETLYPVIDTPNLVEKWRTKDRDETFIRLRQELRIRDLRNTELIQISAEDSDPKFATTLANSIAEEYQRNRIAEQQEQINKALAQLHAEVQDQREKVGQLQTEMTRIREELNITDLDPEKPNPQNQDAKATRYREIKEKYLQAKKVLEAAEKRLATETMQRSMPQAPVTIWERAEPAEHPSSPILALNLLIGGLAGLLAGAVLALVIK